MAEIIREYIIETKRYLKDGKSQYDEWVSNNENIKIEHNYLRCVPTKGKDEGKRLYIPFDNIFVVREG